MLVFLVIMFAIAIFSPSSIIIIEARKGDRLLTALLCFASTIVMLSPLSFLFLKSSNMLGLMFLVSVIAVPVGTVFATSHLLERIENRHFNRK